jgi:hypothetical protein
MSRPASAGPHFWDRARYYGEEQRLANALEAMEKQAVMTMRLRAAWPPFDLETDMFGVAI